MLALALTVTASAQHVDSLFRNEHIDILIDNLAEELDQEGRLDATTAEQLAELARLANEPIDLNACSDNDLNELLFLTESKIRTFLRRREYIGGFRTEQQLLLLPYFTLTDIERLLTFGRIVPQGYLNLIPHQVKAELLGRLQTALPLQRGFRQYNDKPPAFAGIPLKTLLKLKCEINRRWRFGLTLETDAGELRLCHSTPLSDYIGGYAAFQGGGIVRRAVLGNFQVRLGQGLGIWTGFGLSPTLSSVSPARFGTGISPSLSAQENHILRGGAIDLKLLPFRITLFASLVKADVTTANDQWGRFMTTERTDGLHRTATERSYRHNNWLRSVGGYLSYDHQWGVVGVGYNQWHSHLPVRNDGRPYHAGMPEGHDLGTLHADWRFFLGPASFYCEAALQGSRGLAATATLDLRLGHSLLLSLSARHFHPAYVARLQSPVCQTGRAGGEDGVYLGLEGKPLQRLLLRAQADIYHVAVQQMNVLAPQWAVKLRSEARFDFNRHSFLSLRCRHTDKDGTYRPNAKSPNYIVARSRCTSWKLLYNAAPSPRLVLNTLVEGVRAVSVRQALTGGILLCQDFKATSPSGVLQGAASLAWFRTTSYEARVYARQPNVLSDMSFGQCAGHGLRLTAMIRLQPLRNLKLWIWAQGLHYFDRNQISSGHTEVEGANQLTVKLQAQWKLFRHTGRKEWRSVVPGKLPIQRNDEE